MSPGDQPLPGPAAGQPEEGAPDNAFATPRAALEDAPGVRTEQSQRPAGGSTFGPNLRGSARATQTTEAAGAPITVNVMRELKLLNLAITLYVF